MMGNPWSYRGHTLEWSRIRLLTKWDDIEMEYNASGMRTRKGDTYYELDGNNIISETTNGNTIRYYYGNGGVVGFRYNGNRYYYEKNLQGDIIGIYDEDGSKVVSYIYDAWGNCSIENDVSGVRIGEVNPFRYRGYYYDTGLGLYYTANRYYDATICRWINADVLDTLAATPNELTDNNLYAYCDNNPIIREDANGDFWHIAIGAAIGAIVSGAVKVVSNAIENKPLTDGLVTAVVSGAASGALASTGVGVVGMAVGNAAISMAENATNQVIDKGFNDFDVRDMLIDGAIGGISGAIGGRGSGSTYMTNLGKQTVRRTKNAITHKGIVNGLKEAGKALSYYSKNTSWYYKDLIDGIPMDFVSTIGTTIATSEYMKYKYNRLLE